MIVLLAPTEDINRRTKTFLSEQVNAGTMTFGVDDVANLLVDDYVVIGREGSQEAELTQITGITNQTITVAALNLNHQEDEPVTKFRYNQRKFYGCTTETGSFVQLAAGSPVTIMVNNPQGTLLEYTGNEGYLFFIATYYNSETGDETSVSSSIVMSGDDSGRYCSLYQIRKQSGTTDNPNIDDGYIEEKRKQAENEINSIVFERYQMPLVDTITGANSVPAMIERIAVLLAGGYVSWEQEGQEGEGGKYLGEGRALLTAIQKGRQRLIDANYNEYKLKKVSSAPMGGPDHVDDRHGPVRLFTMEQLF